MAVLACAYGVLKAGSIWLPINLLAASVYSQSLKLDASQLNAFHADSFAIALGIHALVSTTVGLLYGAMLPMFARRPIVLGGLIGPVLWSGLLYSMLSLLNPTLESHIDWLWFVASQVAFGIVAGLIVVRQPRVATRCSRFLVGALTTMSVGPVHGCKTLAKSRGSAVTPFLRYRFGVAARVRRLNTPLIPLRQSAPKRHSALPAQGN